MSGAELTAIVVPVLVAAGILIYVVERVRRFDVERWQARCKRKGF